MCKEFGQDFILIAPKALANLQGSRLSWMIEINVRCEIERLTQIKSLETLELPTLASVLVYVLQDNKFYANVRTLYKVRCIRRSVRSQISRCLTLSLTIYLRSMGH